MLLQKLKHIGSLKVLSASKAINIFLLDNVKVDVVDYDYDWLAEPVFDRQLKLASIADIAAMKLSAITNRGTKKDFIDIFFLLERFSLSEMMSFYSSKYPEGNEFLVLKSLGYFADAEDEPMPFMFENIMWKSVKEKIKSTVRAYQ